MVRKIVSNVINDTGCTHVNLAKKMNIAVPGLNMTGGKLGQVISGSRGLKGDELLALFMATGTNPDDYIDSSVKNEKECNHEPITNF